MLWLRSKFNSCSSPNIWSNTEIYFRDLASHTKGFTPQLKAQQIHRNIIHQVLLPIVLDEGTMAIAGLLAV